MRLLHILHHHHTCCHPVVIRDYLNTTNTSRTVFCVFSYSLITTLPRCCAPKTSVTAASKHAAMSSQLYFLAALSAFGTPPTLSALCTNLALLVIDVSAPCTRSVCRHRLPPLPEFPMQRLRAQSFRSYSKCVPILRAHITVALSSEMRVLLAACVAALFLSVSVCKWAALPGQRAPQSLIVVLRLSKWLPL